MNPLLLWFWPLFGEGNGAHTVLPVLTPTQITLSASITTIELAPSVQTIALPTTSPTS